MFSLVMALTLTWELCTTSVVFVDDVIYKETTEHSIKLDQPSPKEKYEVMCKDGNLESMKVIATLQEPKNVRFKR